jgi:hypothetical protein
MHQSSLTTIFSPLTPWERGGEAEDAPKMLAAELFKYQDFFALSSCLPSRVPLLVAYINVFTFFRLLFVYFRLEAATTIVKVKKPQQFVFHLHKIFTSGIKEWTKSKSILYRNFSDVKTAINWLAVCVQIKIKYYHERKSMPFLG